MTDNTPLRLVHLANFNSTNIGNGALANGLELVLEEDFSHAIKWTRLPWDDFTFNICDFDHDFMIL
jgi:hypothetical protein